MIRFLLSAATIVVCAGLSEKDRLAEYYARNHTWPPTYDPPLPGWRAIMERRYEQVARIPDRGERYNAYIETTRSAVTTPNFTETGWGLTRAPEDLMRALREGIREGVEKGPRLERAIDVIQGPQAWFIDRPDLTERVLKELKPMHEQWSGQKLVGNNAYGFRLYRNSSALFMHVDKPDTHIISCILHIDRSEDSEPWPILIEDFQGNTNEVILESGDMLFYESSKCFHGRSKPFVGSWYSSIFVHYYPVGWDMSARRMNAHYAVPPHWADDVSTGGGVKACSDENAKCHFWATKGECSSNPKWMLDHCQKSCGSCVDSGNKEEVSAERDSIDWLEMSGTGMREPECPHNWCAFRDGTTKWHGPGEDGMVITTGKKYSLWAANEKERGSEL